MSETVAAASSLYAVMASWLTPSCLFLFINLVIGTIAITSRFANTSKNQHQLVPSPSLLQRLTSFNLRHHKHEPKTTLHSIVDPVESLDSSTLNPIHSSSMSLMDQNKSSNLNLNEEKIERLNPVDLVKVTESSQLDQVSSSSILDGEIEGPDPVLKKDESPQLNRVKSFGLSVSKVETGSDPNQQQPITRAPSLFQRLMSLTFERSESVKESKAEITGDGEEREEEEGVDAKADDFINRFRQQLRLQRLDSILRYRDMLK
ncbi:hypothetical protein VNO78_03380 [Psophocarpus tetragonolobus]|uniref:DUF4408 domain-containing protein n=1 Tax=Psophocarpus tetragonolobus TaxID=3891 RepID=A0AAN9T0G2_PSOTE